MVLLLSVTSFASIDESLKKHIKYAEGTNHVGHLYIGGHNTQISESTYLYIKKGLDYFRDELHPIFIILELDTPGGEVFAAQKISDALKQIDTQYDIPIVAVVNNWAISAGALLAYSSRYIAAVKDASIGAAAPVTQTGEATSEKVNSAIRADFENRASFFDRNPLIAKAMVDADVILVQREGKIVELEKEEQILPSDKVISRKGKLLTLNSKEMIEFGVADIALLPEKIVPLTAEEKKRGEWGSRSELLFTHPFFNEIPHVEIKSYRMDWKTHFFAFLTSPLISSLLVLGLLVGAYIEFSTPGFGVAGSIALICLGCILLSSFAFEAIAWLEFIILGVGVLLLLLELFVIPGFGIVGILGIVLIVGALLVILLPGIGAVRFDFDTQTWNAAGEYFLVRVTWLAVTFIVGVVVIALLAKYVLPKIALFSPLILKDDQMGYQAGMTKEELPDVGAVGIVLSPLRTAGKVEIGGKLYDAVSNGRFIESGTSVEVISIEGSKVIVKEKV